jgi:hypothetical protein
MSLRRQFPPSTHFGDFISDFGDSRSMTDRGWRQNAAANNVWREREWRCGDQRSMLRVDALVPHTSRRRRYPLIRLYGEEEVSLKIVLGTTLTLPPPSFCPHSPSLRSHQYVIPVCSSHAHAMTAGDSQKCSSEFGRAWSLLLFSSQPTDEYMYVYILVLILLLLSDVCHCPLTIIQ